MVIGFGVCVGSWVKFQANVLPHAAGRPLVALSGQTSIAAAYNRILDAYSDTNLDALVLQHDDLEIIDPDADAKFLEAIAGPDVLLAGVAGGDGRHGLAWWNHDPVGHQRTDHMNIDFGRRIGDVTLLEGSLLVFSPAAIVSLRFDETLDGFHGYDEIGMQSIAALGRNVVVDVDTWHHNSMGFRSEASHAEWQRGDQYYRRKWGL